MAVSTTTVALQVDTPDSDDRPQRAIPDTTQRRLEGFCLNTPLTLSQQAQQEVGTSTTAAAVDHKVNTGHPTPLLTADHMLESSFHHNLLL